jgi:uncharacterized protein (TIGR00296 family)
LHEGLREYALTSALHDQRFEPVGASELPTLQCGVSLLSPFFPIKDPLDFEIGTHGLQIEFAANGKAHRGTYLPEVAAEQGWDHEQTLASLVLKAGFKGRAEDVMGAIHAQRYETSKALLTHAQFLSMRSGDARAAVVSGADSAPTCLGW